MFYEKYLESVGNSEKLYRKGEKNLRKTEEREGAGVKKIGFGKEKGRERGGATLYFCIYNIFYMTLGY